MMVGKQMRLNRLFSNGNPVIIAADHGSYMGPFAGIERLPEQIFQFSKADAFLVMPGMAKQCQHFFGQKDAPLCIIRLNWAAHYCKPHVAQYEKGYNVRFCDVEHAVALGADIVIVSLLLGTDEAANVANIREFGELVQQAAQLGIPVIGEYIPFGGIDRYHGNLESLLLGVRACAEFGADLIKTVYVDQFAQIANSSVVPALALGGGLTEKPAEAFAIAANAMSSGAKGIVFGRNVICAERPEQYLDALISVVKQGCSPIEAEQQYFASIAN